MNDTVLWLSSYSGFESWQFYSLLVLMTLSKPVFYQFHHVWGTSLVVVRVQWLTQAKLTERCLGQWASNTEVLALRELKFPFPHCISLCIFSSASLSTWNTCLAISSDIGNMDNCYSTDEEIWKEESICHTKETLHISLVSHPASTSALGFVQGQLIL